MCESGRYDTLDMAFCSLKPEFYSPNLSNQFKSVQLATEEGKTTGNKSPSAFINVRPKLSGILTKILASKCVLF